jgi:hypothetical protein
MRKYYYYILFLLVAALVFIFHRKIEHLTVEEDDRITKLEDEYTSLHATLTSQEERMKAATSQATEAQAFLNTPID